MNLRDMAVHVLNRGTLHGTEGGTGCPTDANLTQGRRTVEFGIITGFVGENTHCPTVPGTGCGTVGQFQKSGTPCGTASETLEPDSILAGHHVLVHLEPIGDVWLASDEQAAAILQAEGLPVLLEKDIQWILQAQGHEARLDRLVRISGRRHPTVRLILDVFPGSKVTGVKHREVDHVE